MANGICYETRPISSECEAEYHAWYDEVHLPEVVALEGFAAARGLSPVDDHGPFVAIYEIEADDLQIVVNNLFAAAAAGRLHIADVLQKDPPPTVRLLRCLLRMTSECASSRT
ncbi:conserved hypothetical protein [Frankia sp. Hr75.2]|nr:conserved hypothetical protein [Frankia sp. Hr75.2]